KRSKRMTTSVLDGVPGLGEHRRKALLKQFGSLKRLRNASVDEIATVPGIGRRTAEAVVKALAAESSAADSSAAESLPAESDGGSDRRDEAGSSSARQSDEGEA